MKNREQIIQTNYSLTRLCSLKGIAKLILILIVPVFFAACPLFSAAAKEKIAIGTSGYPVPRYVSLAKDTVNVRTGPDGKYPVIWIFKKAQLPVKVIAEYKEWRKIVDSEGAIGWIWGPLLSSQRTALIIAEQQPLLKEPQSDSSVVLIAEAGVIGKIHQCQAGWCELNINGFKGWLKQANFWGTIDEENFD